MSKRYNVLVPIAGAVHVTVEAETDSDAVDQAIEDVSRFLGEMSEPDCGPCSLESLEAYEKLVEGNVCNVPTSSVEIEEADDG